MICLQKKSVICYGPDSPTYMRRMAIPIKITIVNKNNKNILMCSEQWRWDWLSPKIQREYRRPHWGMFYIIWMIVDCDDLRSSLRWKCGSIGLWQFLVWDLFFLEPPNKTGLTLYHSPNIITVHPCYPFWRCLFFINISKQAQDTRSGFDMKKILCHNSQRICRNVFFFFQHLTIVFTQSTSWPWRLETSQVPQPTSTCFWK